MAQIIKAKTVEEAILKAQKLFDRDIKELEYRIISYPDKENEYYTIEFNVKPSVIGKSEKLYGEIFSEQFEVIISEDKMKAYLFLPKKINSSLQKDYIINLLSEAGVKAGINEAEIEKLIKNYNNGIISESYIVAAHGKNPKNGNNAELIIKTKSEDIMESFFEAEAIEDRIDYKETFKQKLLIVEEDEEVAMIIPPTKGEYGYTVDGAVIEAFDGKDVNLELSDNLRKEGNKIIANKKGLLSIKQTGELTYQLDILDTFVVNGNVDYSTGNIDFPGSVIIRGEIKADFTVKAKGDIVAKSISGNAFAEGKITVLEGITGKSFANKLKISAKGEITATYIQFASINSESNIKVKKYIRDSIIYCNDTVEAEMIYGGKITATKGIKVKTLGSPSFTKTIVVAGIHPEIVNKIAELVEEKNRINENLTKIRLYLGNIENKMIKDKLKDKIEKAQITKRELNKKLFLTETKIKELYEQIKQQKDAKIEVLKEVYPNVKVIIGEAVLTTEKKIRNGYFFYNKSTKSVDYLFK